MDFTRRAERRFIDAHSCLVLSLPCISKFYFPVGSEKPGKRGSV